MKCESVQEFLARGGKIQKVKKGSKNTTSPKKFMSLDPQLTQLNKLLKRDGLSNSDRQKVEIAISKRKQQIFSWE